MVRKIQDSLLYFNEFNLSIQLTVEVEFHNAVPFLDTKVNQSITLDWNTKLTFFGRYINYYSNHPLSQKVNTLGGY